MQPVQILLYFQGTDTITGVQGNQGPPIKVNKAPPTRGNQAPPTRDPRGPTIRVPLVPPTMYIKK